MHQINRRAFAGMAAASLATPALAARGPEWVIPLELHGDNLIVQVTLDGQGPFPFSMATGSLYGSVSESLARKVGLKSNPVPPVDLYNVNGQIALQLFKTKSFVLGGVWDLKQTELIGRPYPPNASTQGAFPFVPRSVSAFDFDIPEMRLLPLRFQPPPGAVKYALVQESGPGAQAPMIRVQFGDQTLRLMLNTGQDQALILYPDPVRRLKLWDRAPDAPTSEEEDMDGREYGLRSVLAGPLSLGGMTFDKVPVQLMDPAHAGRDYIDVDGVIGMALLRRFRIVFDPPKQTAWLTPTARAGEPFS